jgi:hypothetical protein
MTPYKNDTVQAKIKYGESSVTIEQFNKYVFNILLEYSAFIAHKMVAKDPIELKKEELDEIVEKISKFNNYLNQKINKDEHIQHGVDAEAEEKPF